MRVIGLSICVLVLATASALAHGDLHLQIEDATKLIAQQPGNADLYLKRGELHRAHQDWDAAQADYDFAFNLKPSLAVIDLARGKMFLEANWPLSALVALDQMEGGDLEPDTRRLSGSTTYVRKSKDHEYLARKVRDLVRPADAHNGAPRRSIVT